MPHRSLGLQGTADRQSPLGLEGLALPCLRPCLASMAKLSSASPESLGRPSARCQLVLNVASKSPVLFVCMSNCIAVVCSQWPGIAFSIMGNSESLPPQAKERGNKEISSLLRHLSSLDFRVRIISAKTFNACVAMLRRCNLRVAAQPKTMAIYGRPVMALQTTVTRRSHC